MIFQAIKRFFMPEKSADRTWAEKQRLNDEQMLLDLLDHLVEGQRIHASRTVGDGVEHATFQKRKGQLLYSYWPYDADTAQGALDIYTQPAVWAMLYLAITELKRRMQ